MADEKTPEQEHEEQEETAGGQMTRRQFLVGAGVGAVVGAAGVAGVLTLAKPATPEVKPAPGQPAAAVAKVEEVAEKILTLKINGQPVNVVAQARYTLADVLRYQLGLTGAKIGCNHAECGNCTVVMDGKDVYSCTVLAFAAEGHEIVTIEGIAKNTSSLEGLHPIQRAFVVNDGAQCGFCTPGQIMSAYTLLQTNKNPTEAEIRQNLSGNLCRCGNYNFIVKSVVAAAKEMRG